MEDEDREALFNRLVEEKATCLEFAWNGWIKIYEPGEKPCECQSCFCINQFPRWGDV